MNIFQKIFSLTFGTVCSDTPYLRGRKLRLIIFVLFFLPVSAFTQNQSFEFGNIYFALSPKILKDGSMTDLTLGYRYSEKSTGELRMRFSNTVKNAQFDAEIRDSLNAINDSNTEIYLLPFAYYFIRNPWIESRIGAGAYYNYHTLNEKGYFNMPELELLGKERVNSFSNDFSSHVIGPDIDAGFTARADWLTFSVNGGIVPVFYLQSNQKMRIVPLLDPHYAEYSQRTSGSPYVYGDISCILFKYVSIAFLYDLSRLDYAVIDFDDTLNWYYPERTVISQSLKIEASLLLPMGNNMSVQIGYGHTFDSTELDSASPAWSSRQYIIFSARKTQ
jgi:hypothetical protein